MARQAELLRGLDQRRVVRRSMDVVTTEACHASPIHQALDKVIALHAVLVPRAISEMGEREIAKLVLLELPEILQVRSLIKPNGPIVVLPFNRVFQRLSLRMTLNAGIVRAPGIEPRGVHNRGWHGPLNMFAARTMTFFAAHVPFCDLLRFHVVVYGVAAVASRPRRTFHVVGWIERDPPVRVRLHYGSNAISRKLETTTFRSPLNGM